MSLKGKHYAEMHGSNSGRQMIEGVFNAKSQADAIFSIATCLAGAFQRYGKLDIAVANGIATSIVNVMERGRDAIRAEPL
jgi:hypothetical protein